MRTSQAERGRSERIIDDALVDTLRHKKEDEADSLRYDLVLETKSGVDLEDASVDLVAVERFDLVVDGRFRMGS